MQGINVPCIFKKIAKAVALAIFLAYSLRLISCHFLLRNILHRA